MQKDTNTGEEMVLSFLADAGDDFVPTEILSGKLGLTTRLLFRSVESLRKKGYRIDAGHHGYRLVEVPDKLSALELAPLLSTRELGREVHYVEQTASTQQLAHTFAAEGAPHGQLVIAERQTEGRGRRGRAWVTPPGMNLCVSMVLRPTLPPARAPELTLVAAVALADTLEAAGVKPAIKWPNDVQLSGLKVAGTLTKSFHLMRQLREFAARFSFSMLPVAASALCLLLPSCKEAATDASAPSAAPVTPAPVAPAPAATPQAAAEDPNDPCRPSAVVTLKQLMECRLAPYATMGRGEKEPFLRALEAVRLLSPDPAWDKPGDPNGWSGFVDRALTSCAQTGECKTTCKACHNVYMRDYRKQYRDRRIDEVLGGPVP